MDATNETARHTPGEVKRLGCPGGAIFWIEDADGNEVLRVRANGYDDEADAARRIRLYAAAPDLLAVVQMITGNGIPGPMPHYPPANLASSERLAEIVDAARTALARAKGGVS